MTMGDLQRNKIRKFKGTENYAVSLHKLFHLLLKLHNNSLPHSSTKYLQFNRIQHPEVQ